MAKKTVGLMFVNLGIAFLLSSCVTPLAPSTGGIQPYFLPRDTRASVGPTDNRDRIYEFLEGNVLARTMSMSAPDSRIDQGRIATDYAATKTLTNLRKTRYGLEFDLKWTVKQTNYDWDSRGQRTGLERVWDREGTVRYHLKQMRSTGEVIGYADVVSFTTKSDIDMTSSASAVRMRLSNGKLIIEEAWATYDDCFALGGRFEPGWSHMEEVLDVKGGKLSWYGLSQSYEFNPRTGRFEPEEHHSYPFSEVTAQ